MICNNIDYGNRLLREKKKGGIFRLKGIVQKYQTTYKQTNDGAQGRRVGEFYT